MYLTYEEYIQMGGTISSAAFVRFEYKARAYIDRITHNRIRDETPVRESVKHAMFDVIELCSQRETMDAGSTSVGITSKSNDGVSVTYADAVSAKRQWSERFGRVAVEFLADEVKNGVPLLYGGVQFDSVR